MEGPPRPVPGLLGRAGPRPCPVTPGPGLSAPQPPAPLQGRQQRQAVPMPLTAAPSFAGSAWPRRWAPTASWWGHRVLWGAWGVVGGVWVIPARHLYSPAVLCLCACPRVPCACPYHVCEGHTHAHTCALSACVLCCEIPLPMRAACLPPSPCAGPVPGTVPGHSHPWDPAGSEPRRVPTWDGVPYSANPLPRQPCAHAAQGGRGQSLRAPAPLSPHAISMGRPGGCPTAGQAARLQGGPGAGGHPAPPPPNPVHPPGQGPCKVPLAAGPPGAVPPPLLSQRRAQRLP